jgi:hypothetical protein
LYHRLDFLSASLDCGCKLSLWNVMHLHLLVFAKFATCIIMHAFAAHIPGSPARQSLGLWSFPVALCGLVSEGGPYGVQLVTKSRFPIFCELVTWPLLLKFFVS